MIKAINNRQSTILYMIYLFTILFGLLFGSFLNVCIHRIPRVHVKLTEQSLANLRDNSLKNTKQPIQASDTQMFEARHNKRFTIVKNFFLNHLLPIVHFFGWYPDLNENNIPPDILTKLKNLKNKDYATINDFVVALEEHLGSEQTALYGDVIFRYASFNKESIVFPSSHCPACHAHIKPWDNVPVLSFILLRGKCRSCQTKISLRYPLVELLTAVLFLAVVHQFSISLLTFVYLAFVAALIVISCIDLDHQIIPDKISLPGIGVGIIASSFLPLPATLTHWYGSFLGAFVGGGVIMLVGYIGAKVFKKEAMGGGDVKLMAMIGAFLGWKLALLTIFFGSLVGAIVGIMMKLITGKEYIPFGPFLSVGALITLFFGQHVLFWYWNLVFPPL